MIAVILIAALGLVIVLHARGLRHTALVGAQPGGSMPLAGAAMALNPVEARRAEDTAGPRPPSPASLAFERFRNDRAAFAAGCFLLAITTACLAGPFLLSWSPTQIDGRAVGATAPSARHLLGTDAVARDELARLLAAGRISLLIGAAVALCSVAMGALVGTVAGFFGGHVDRVLMWCVDIMLAIPPLPLLIALSVLVSSRHSAVGRAVGSLPEQWRIIVVMSSLGWMSVSRVVRAEVRSIRRLEFVEAASALGASPIRIMARHITPNCAPTMVVFVTFGVSGAILGESFLSFLGVGVNPPTPTWGNMISESSDLFSVLRFWWLVWAPATAILATVLCANFVGDGLRAVFDPQSASSG